MKSNHLTKLNTQRYFAEGECCEADSTGVEPFDTVPAYFAKLNTQRYFAEGECCEADSTGVEPFDTVSAYLAKLNTQRYRSGHNGADSKSVCG